MPNRSIDEDEEFDRRAEERDERRQAKIDERQDQAPDVACDECHRRQWTFIGVDPNWGADADGRRGIRVTEWQCVCGNTLEYEA